MQPVILFYYAIKFATEIFLASFCYTGSFVKKKYFVGRSVGFLLLLYGFSVCYNREMASIYPIRVARYLLLFAVMVLYLYEAYELTVKEAFFCGISCYCTQNAMVRIQGIAGIFLPKTMGPMPMIFLYVASMAGIYLLFGLIFGRRMANSRKGLLKNDQVLILGTAVLNATVFLSALQTTPEEKSAMLTLKEQGYGLMCCLLFLSMQLGIFTNNKLNDELETIGHIMDVERRQMEISKETIDLINIKCHDMKRQLSRVKGDRISQEMIDDLKERISIYDTIVRTGNKTIDTVLMEQGLLCENNHISLMCMGDGTLLDYMADADVYSLFGNLLDNAREASMKIQEQDRRAITLEIRRSMGMVLIRTENFFAGELEWKDGLPVTDKDDGKYHGFGVKSIGLIAGKYGGNVSMKAEGDRFICTITLPEATVTEGTDPAK